MDIEIAKFINQTDNLVSELLYFCPNDKNIKIYSEKFNIAKKIDPEKIFDRFLYYVYYYKEEIMNKNDDFFLKKSKNVEESYNILNLTEQWKTQLDDEQKDKIWIYFKFLIMLSDRIIKKRNIDIIKLFSK